MLMSSQGRPRRRYQHHKVDSHSRLYALLLSLLLATSLSACAAISPGRSGPPAQIGYTPVAQGASRVRFAAQDAYSLSHPFFAARITFTSNVSFSQALQLVTNLGLQPVNYCIVIGIGYWTPLSEQPGFAQHPVLEVAATRDAPPDWLERLNANSSITAIFDGWSGCALIPSVATPYPGSGDGAILSEDYQRYAGVVVQAQFSATTSYAQALSIVANLGFRLANPCYEQAQQKAVKPVWRSPGQAQSFAATHRLVIATTSVNAVVWQSQLLATPGVTTLVQPYQPTCAG